MGEISQILSTRQWSRRYNITVIIVIVDNTLITAAVINVITVVSINITVLMADIFLILTTIIFVLIPISISIKMNTWQKLPQLRQGWCWRIFNCFHILLIDL